MTRVFLLAALAAWLVGTAPSLARAQAKPDASAIEEAKRHFAKGKELYDAGDKKGAVEEFKEAYKLTRNPLLLYNIGLVYDELGDGSLALHYYQKFLSDAPDDERTRENRHLAAERVKALPQEIAEKEAAAAPAKEKTGEKAPPAQQTTSAEEPARGAAAAPTPGGRHARTSVTEFTHEVVEEAPPGKPLDIVARIPDDADWTLTLYYRTPGRETFEAVRMKPRYTEFVGRIPPSATARESSLQYYIEAKDRTGEIVARSGRASSPNIVYIEAGARPHYYRDLEERPMGGLDESASEDEEELPAELGGGHADRPTDRPSKSRSYLKWGTTGGAAALLGGALIFYLSAQSHASALEGEAASSQNGNCGAPPCTTFGDYQKDVESAGKAYERWANITLVAGVITGGVAGTLWYLDLTRAEKSTRDRREARRAPRLVGTPAIGRGFVGGAASLEW